MRRVGLILCIVILFLTFSACASNSSEVSSIRDSFSADDKSISSSHGETTPPNTASPTKPTPSGSVSIPQAPVPTPTAAVKQSPPPEHKTAATPTSLSTPAPTPEPAPTPAPTPEPPPAFDKSAYTVLGGWESFSAHDAEFNETIWYFYPDGRCYLRERNIFMGDPDYDRYMNHWAYYTYRDGELRLFTEEDADDPDNMPVTWSSTESFSVFSYYEDDWTQAYADFVRSYQALPEGHIESMCQQIAEHYNRELHPDGTYICFADEFDATKDQFFFVLRYLCSDKEAKERMDAGLLPVSNAYIADIQVNKSTGSVTDTIGSKQWVIKFP